MHLSVNIVVTQMLKAATHQYYLSVISPLILAKGQLAKPTLARLGL